MRKLIDTNVLKSPDLKEYLENPDNHVAIPDLVIVETLRGGDLESVFRQLEVLTLHPKQVLVLKTTHAVAGLRKAQAPRPSRAACGVAMLTLLRVHFLAPRLAYGLRFALARVPLL
jgi:hypothetical protein